MGQSFKIATIFGIPIRIHITLVIFFPLIAIQFTTGYGPAAFLFGLAGAAGLFLSVALHELGHSVVALAFGCRVRDIILLPIGGVAELDRFPNRPFHEFLIAIAGPAVSLLLAAGFWFAGAALANEGVVQAGKLGLTLGFINLMLAFFNLLPAFPMDGGRVFRAALTPKFGRLAATRIAAGIGKVMAALFFIWGLFFNGGLMLVAIAVFIWFAGRAEYRAVLLQEQAGRGFARSPWFGYPPNPSAGNTGADEATVSPPPYGHGPDGTTPIRPLQRGKGIFDFFDRGGRA